jgi:hypothetical protein
VDELGTVFKGASLTAGGGAAEEPDDGGRTATGHLISEARARDIKVIYDHDDPDL